MPARETLIAIRFGQGLPLSDTAPRDPKAMLAALAGPDLIVKSWPIPGFDQVAPRILASQAASRAAEKDPAKMSEKETANAVLQEMAAKGLRSTLARAVDAADGFRERLVSFWADHFTVVAGSPRDACLPLALVEDAIRPNLTGPFDRLLTAVETHPAMLGYLDQALSIGPGSPLGKRKGAGLNENLARELLELHTLGVGAGYSQDDVRQLAELLTGLTFDYRRGQIFDKRRAEPGAETVLGQTYDGTGMETIARALQDIAARPETAAHLARKLAVHFVSDRPDPALVKALTQAYARSGGQLDQVYAALLDHPAAWAPRLDKARQPWDFLVAALRALGVTGAEVMALPDNQFQQAIRGALRAMGQQWKHPRGPDGWPEEAEAWITPQGLAARIDWAMAMPARLAKPMPEPESLMRRALADQASEALVWAVGKAERRAEGVGIVLASADFNRR